MATNTSRPVFVGQNKVGVTLEAVPGTWTTTADFVEYEYQWMRYSSSGAYIGDIAGANQQQYTLQQADKGYRVAVRVTGKDKTNPPTGSSSLLRKKSPTALGIMNAPGPNLVEFDLNDGTRTSATLGSGTSSKDLRITQTGLVTSGSMAEIRGYRHVEWIRGELKLESSSNVSGSLPIKDCTGIVHLEGIWLHGAKMVDNLVWRSKDSPVGFKAQVQNCRFEAHEDPAEHADCIQFQQVKLDAFDYDKCTFYSELQGTFMRVGGSAVDYAKNGYLSRINYRGPGDNMFWQAWENNDTTPDFKKIVPIKLEDVWIAEDGDTRPVGMRVVPRMDFTASNQTGGPHRGNYVATDSISEYARFSTSQDVVPTGSAAGQKAYDCGITGVVRKGVPPGGDFAPTGLAGMSYISPGYV